MFTLPPLPPKDYVLRDVNQNQRSCQEHTPTALPRITQTSLAKFCAPVQYQENEKLASLDIDVSVNRQVLERWTDKARAFWVDKPGKDAYFMHDIFNKYTVEVVPSYDARFKHSEHVFYRSFKYELECFEEERLKKLYSKMEREENEEREKNKKIIEEKIAKIDTSMGIKSCERKSPFWWQGGGGKDKLDEGASSVKKPTETATYEWTHLRWQDEPQLLESAKKDPRKRRTDMAL
ncbi:hypothetical protein BDFB_011595 [Asbolus verrucosus]|uniref:Uncharacterized protein n=1 Tax=Asbolus verrucosus TaxID=1661398 RepID=A0A482W3G5_ASBVE|nr:hypothetical protein BDFB_011595 [Asbolus verrucosus]